jgi:hypothetical protein
MTGRTNGVVSIDGVIAFDTNAFQADEAIKAQLFESITACHVIVSPCC